MPPAVPCTLCCLVIAILCNVCESLGQESSRRSFLARRAVDGTRGRKYFDPVEEGSLDSYGSAGGKYDAYEDTIDESTDLSDIRENVPGEPGIDYPAYTSLPQTGFTCEGRSRGYYADEATGCQVFHVCHDILVSSFLCPIGSVFSQLLLTCDWWSKVDCSSTRKYIDTNKDSFEESDDDDMIRKAYAMMGLQPEKDVPDVPVDPDQSGRMFYQSTSKENAARNGFDKYPSSRTSSINGFKESYGNYGNQQVGNNQGYREPHVVYSEERDKNSNDYRDTIIQDPFYHPPVEYPTHRPPHQDSPIIRIQTIGSNQDYRPNKNRFDDSYRSSEQYDSGFQPSYAPTVPTITTTTRKYYSPTVPTAYKSTTANYKFYQQNFDDSDSQVAQSQDSRSFVTEPTMTYEKEGDKNDDGEDSGIHHAQVTRNSPGYRGFYSNGQSNRFSNGDYKNSQRTGEDSGDGENFEIEESIGLGRALDDSPRKLTIQAQNTEENDQSKSTGSEHSEVLRTNANSSNISTDKSDVSQEDSKGFDSVSSGTTYGRSDYDSIDKMTTVNFETESFLSTFGRRTTPLVKNRSTTPVQNFASTGTTPSTLNYQATAEPYTETTTVSTYSFDEDAYFRQVNDDQTSLLLDDKFLSTKEEFFDDHKNETRSEPAEPSEFLKPPFDFSGFRINVSDVGIFPPEITTSLPTYATTSNAPDVNNFFTNERNVNNTPITLSERIEAPIENSYQKALAGSSFVNNSPADLGTSITTPNSLLTTISPPPAEIFPPFEYSNYDSSEFLNSQAESEAFLQSSPREQNPSGDLEFKQNQTELDYLSEYGNKFQFTIRDALQEKPSSDLPCLFASSHGICSTPSWDTNSEIKSLPEITPTVSTSSTTAKETKSDDTIILNNQNQNTENSQVEVSTLSTLFQPPKIENPQENSNVDSSTDKSATSNLFQIVQSESPKENSDVGILIEASSSRPFESNQAFNAKQSQINSQDNGFRSTTETPARNNLLRYIQSQNLQQNQGLHVPYRIADRQTPNPAYQDINKNTSPQRIQERNQTFADNLNDFLIVKSIERTAFTTASPERNENTRHILDRGGYSILQLMSELLKTDRVPRPFSLKDSRSIELTTRSNYGFNNPFTVTTTSKPIAGRSQLNEFADDSIVAVTPKATNSLKGSTVLSENLGYRGISLNYQSQINQSDSSDETLKTATVLPSTNYRPILKEQILDQLTKNFGRPLYQVNQESDLKLSNEQRSVDSKINQSTKDVDETKKDESSVESDYNKNSSTISRTAVTEKTIIKTEVVPALGFSLDDIEEREKYAETLLGGFLHDGGILKRKDSRNHPNDTSLPNIESS